MIADGPSGMQPPARSKGRYFRLFEPRFAMLAQALTPAQLVATVRLGFELLRDDRGYVLDCAATGKCIGLCARAWRELRSVLIARGFLRVEGDRLIDDDQCESLRIQQRASARSKAANTVRWASRHTVPGRPNGEATHDR